ncbi:progranulin-like isoform X1 [Parasteatoda tepidariorum]|uniref:progranulin-like isoform X1 n=2 Tax=Parasteatoda tepidariorum TaxID=114398 RepID=UPI001C726DDC|nr:progranulin-like isoform X1 [Parasteatoda tepidariorum]
MKSKKMKCLIIVLLVAVVSSNKHQCPGTTFSCDDSATCCQLLDKSYGCCPLLNAVCCDDHIHCCPANTKCSAGMCIQQTSRGVTSFLANPIRAKNVTCPGGQFTCPDDTTCCEGSAPGSYGCCPLEDAVCCEDKEHCCPSGTTCNLKELKCDGDGFTSLMYDSKKKLHRSHNVEMDQIVEMEPSSKSNFVCPGSSFQCPDVSTCCKLPGDEWGCCPFENATCCEDKVHCCPEGMTCNVAEQSCERDGFTYLMFDSKKKLHRSHNVKMDQIVEMEPSSVSNVVCPGSSFQCPDLFTCCKLPGAEWGCCPFENATCCADKLHCCPEGMTCDATSTHCSRGFYNVTSVRNVPAMSVKSELIICPDHSQCQDSMTCCQLKNNKYGCCQYPNATCCPDGLHCCKNGYKCDEGKKQCVKDALESNMV